VDGWKIFWNNFNRSVFYDYVFHIEYPWRNSVFSIYECARFYNIVLSSFIFYIDILCFRLYGYFTLEFNTCSN